RALPSIDNLPEKKRELFRLMLDSLQALVRENYDVIWGSMIKQTMQRKQPYFNESYYGYKSFSELLEDAQRLGLLSMKKDAKSGGYIISALPPLGLAPGCRGGPCARPPTSGRGAEAGGGAPSGVRGRRGRGARK